MSKILASKGLMLFTAAVFAASFAAPVLAQDKPATPKTTAPKAKSACQGLDETTCKGKGKECQWIAATKTKDGKDRKAYCRLKPAPKAKKAT